MKGIYKLSINDYYYIGSSKNLGKRKTTHLSQLKNNKHHNIFLQRIYNKYKSEINFEILELIEDENFLKKIEQEFLDIHLIDEKCVNIGSLASGGDNLSNNPNKELIKQKISKTLKEKNALLTQKERNDKFGLNGKNNGNWKGGKCKCRCGNDLSYSAKGNLCINCIDRSGNKNSFYNKKHSEETKEKIRKKALVRLKNKKPKNIRKVMIGNKIFETVTEAAKYFAVVCATILFRIKSKNFNDYKYVD